jgi:hypothetical protein
VVRLLPECCGFHDRRSSFATWGGISACVLAAMTFAVATAAETLEEVRKDLSPYLGEWNLRLTMHGAENGPPAEFHGRGHYERIGRGWLVERIDAEASDARYQLQEVLGYDFSEHRWIAVLVDSESAYPVRSTGKRDSQGQIVFVGRRRDAASGEWETVTRLDTWQNDQEFVTDFTATPAGGTEYSLLKIFHTRIPSPTR